jgi:hypothetical protein
MEKNYKEFLNAMVNFTGFDKEYWKAVELIKTFWNISSWEKLSLEKGRTILNENIVKNKLYVLIEVSLENEYFKLVAEFFNSGRITAKEFKRLNRGRDCVNDRSVLLLLKYPDQVPAKIEVPHFLRNYFETVR